MEEDTVVGVTEDKVGDTRPVGRDPRRWTGALSRIFLPPLLYLASYSCLSLVMIRQIYYKPSSVLTYSVAERLVGMPARLFFLSRTITRH
jgi:hypothetical protein